MREPPPADLNRVYVLTDSGLHQLKGGSTALPESALRLLVLIDGKLPLVKLVKHLQGVSAPELNKIVSELNVAGHVKPVSADAAKQADDLGALDFFSQSSVAASTDAEKKEQEFARGLQEAQNTAVKLKQPGYYVRIARRRTEKLDPAGGGYSILVVENDANLASVTRKFLDLEGFSPRIAATGAEVVAELRKSPPPDLVLLDVTLPDADGFEILAMVRKHAALQRLPVILLTGRSSKEDVMRGLALGADGYFTKPFEFDVLILGMKAVLGLE
jgi:two-component system OmpR family response regulator